VTILKSIVVCLALANIGYFLWSRGIGDGTAASAPSSASGASLKLASETSAAAARAPADAAAAGGKAAAGIAGASGGTEAPAAGPASSSEGGGALLTDVKRCISVGPFRDVAEAAHAATTLRSGGYDPRQRVAEGEVWAGVWVYLPITPSRSSDQMQAKLKAGGIDDALEMPGPNEGSVLSLGLFSDSKRAQVRISQAQALGFNPGIADRKRTGDVYWIDIDLKATDSVLKASDLEADSGRIVRLEVKGCPAASGATQP
jgi:hypothetical protein